jgi:excisionase family DNA binding protein
MNPVSGQAAFQYGDAHDEADVPEEEWLRTGQVAALFRVHPRTVIRWAAAGLLPHLVTFGGQRRFSGAGVQALLARRRGQVPEEPGALLSTGEVARRLRVDPRTVARWSRQGRLASIRTLGGHHRYPQAAVERLLAQAGDAPPPSQVETNDNRAAVSAAEVGQPPRAGLDSARTQEP